MSIFSPAETFSRRSATALLAVGVLAGVAVGGGVGVIAASSTKTVTVCANKKTNILRYAKNNKCSKTETKVVLNQTGENGPAGPAGATGRDGLNATLAIAQQAVCDGVDADTTANEICKIGMTGPGGGHIFFVDYNDEFSKFDYLEAAPIGWGNGITVVSGETTGTSTTDPILRWCDYWFSLGLTSWENQAVGAGSANTTKADTSCSSGAIQAASDYEGGAKTDWFLGSMGEMMLMYTNLLQSGVGFSVNSQLYWTSSESDSGTARAQYFKTGEQRDLIKSFTYYVRPMRAF